MRPGRSRPRCSDACGPLARRLGTTDAVVIGLGSMIGAGVFSAFAPAAAAAGSGLLIGLLLAAGVAYCNAVASAQLAAQYPTSGGTYVYGRERLGEWWGFLAGLRVRRRQDRFVRGDGADVRLRTSFPARSGGGVLRRSAAVAVLTGANLRGISRTARLARVLVAASLVALARGRRRDRAGGHAIASHIGGLSSRTAASTACSSRPGCCSSPSPATRGSRRSARRCATPRDDPARDPARARHHGRRCTSSSGSSALAAAGPAALAASHAPLATAVDAAGAAWAVPVVRVGAAVASLGSLLALIAGVGRTTLAMARERRPARAGSPSVHPRHRCRTAPRSRSRGVVALLVLTTDLRGAIGFSSFGVLVYYAIANASAFTQDARTGAGRAR